MKSNSFDIAIVLDVLEHTDDIEALRETARVLRRGGTFIISVPASPILWSVRDARAGHLRRYTRSSFMRVVRAAGLNPEQIGHFQFFLFPLVVASRWLMRYRSRQRETEEEPAQFINWLFSLINRFEAIIASRIPLPWGSSLVAAGRKT